MKNGFEKLAFFETKAVSAAGAGAGAGEPRAGHGDRGVDLPGPRVIY